MEMYWNTSSFIVIAALFSSCQTLSKVQRNDTSSALHRDGWQYAPVHIDGKANEWTEPLFYEDKSTGTSYSITNDRNNLYVLMKVKDSVTQIKIIKKGLILYVNAGSTTRKQNQIRFPLSSGRSILESNEKALSAPQEHVFDNTTIFELAGFRNDKGLYPVWEQSAAGAQIRLGLDNANDLIYEAKIPFHLFYKPFIVKNDQGKHISIGFGFHGFSYSELKKQSNILQNLQANEHATITFSQSLNKELTKNKTVWKEVPIAYR